MSTQTTEYIPKIDGKKSFFFNPKRQFKDFPSQGDKGERVVRENGRIISREGVVYDQRYGWLSGEERSRLRQTEPRLAP